MKDASTTLDRLKQAKDSLMFARDAAERELPASEVRKLNVLVGKVEALQHKIKARCA